MKRIIRSEEKLRVPSKPIKFWAENLKDIDTTYGTEVINALKEVLTAKKDLVALAAPQIGYDARIFCIKFNDVIKTFINPIITRKAEPKFICETCASFPNKQFLLLRPTEVEIKYYNDEFKYEDNKLLGTAASIFDQQYQILDGVLPIDISLVSDINEDGMLTDEDLEHSEEAYEIYKQFIEAKTKAAAKEAATNEEDEKIYKDLKFTEDVVNGRIQVINPELDKEINNAKKKAKKALRYQDSLQKNAERQATRAALNQYLKTHRRGNRR